MHSRFEHSLGVMQTATLLYDSIVRKSADVLIGQLAYDNVGLDRDRQLVRLAALLHDVGHAPFSHPAEELFPKRDEGGERFAHEDYSAAIIRSELRGAINENTEFTADKIATLIEGSAAAK